MRGEHWNVIELLFITKGSSPHARGTPPLRVGVWCPHGIIPACAGNTAGVQERTPRVRDHPRMRGEHLKRLHKVPRYRGSSPHARGTRRGARGARRDGGIIPACAGNTLAEHQKHEGRWDHPRMRGEHSCTLPVCICRLGSSPHARGTHRHARALPSLAGIIPACAGNTLRPAPARQCARDHPRMRGEHAADAVAVNRKTGSSPHARGTLVEVAHAHLAAGIIPACAGNTRQSRHPS